MQRRFKIKVEGHDYDVIVEEIIDNASGLYPDRDTMRAALPEPSRPAREAESVGPGEVVSPLAGIVRSIDVELGTAVQAKTRVATLEAMKTKTMIMAGRAGKVSAIAVSTGQAVEAGQALLTID